MIGRMISRTITLNSYHNIPFDRTMTCMIIHNRRFWWFCYNYILTANLTFLYILLYINIIITIQRRLIIPLYYHCFSNILYSLLLPSGYYSYYTYILLVWVGYYIGLGAKLLPKEILQAYINLCAVGLPWTSPSPEPPVGPVSPSYDPIVSWSTNMLIVLCTNTTLSQALLKVVANTRKNKWGLGGVHHSLHVSKPRNQTQATDATAVAVPNDFDLDPKLATALVVYDPSDPI
jgi:hypothetical protein